MLGKQLKNLRKQKNITQKDLAGMLGVTQQAVAKWESGRFSPEQAMLLRLSEYFGVSTDFLLGRAKATSRVLGADFSIADIPVIGTVKAGFHALAMEEELGTEPAAVKQPANYRYFLVRGDSMEPYIHAGDLALVHCQPTLEDGELGIFIYGEGEAALKKFCQKGDGVILRSFHPDYQDIVISHADLENLYIFGKVVETKTRW